jgi:uncharacterized GH25 family protein
MYHFLLVVVLCVSTAFGVNRATAHELWLQTTQTQIDPSDDIQLHIRIGEFMRGSTQAYTDRGVRQMGYLHNGEAKPLTSRIGDRPAITLPEAQDGLYVIGLETNANRITYQKFEKFENFVINHGIGEAVEAHRARGLAEENFTEGYFRFAKALVDVGDGAGSDAPLGFAYELVALDNPYTDAGDTVRFQLLYRSAPVANHQVDAFFRPLEATGDAEQVKYTTDADGIVAIPRRPGRILVNAVRIEEPTEALAQRLDVVWVSLWASTSYWVY